MFVTITSCGGTLTIIGTKTCQQVTVKSSRANVCQKQSFKPDAYRIAEGLINNLRDYY